MRKGKQICAAVMLLLSAAIFTGPFCHAAESTGRYFTLLDPAGEKLLCTGRRIYLGDVFMAQDNRVYRVVRVKGRTAHAEYVETVDLTPFLPSRYNPEEEPVLPVAAVRDEERPVAIYHTHSDESFVPTDGTASIRYKGGIFEVGKVLADVLEKQGIRVVHSTQPHDPHDARAYSRSRRTALALLRQQRPVALLDVHRDATPPEEYLTEVEGEEVAQVMLVVGRYNPRRKANERFAKEIKAEADSQYPGLIKGIFYARGTHNQDLAPRSLLLEVGTHTLPRELAEKGINMLALAAAPVIQPYATAEQRPDIVREEGKNAVTASLYFIVIALLGGLGFLMLNGRDPADMLRHLKSVLERMVTSLKGYR